MTPDQLEREMFFAIHEFGPTDNGNTGNKEFDKELHRAAKAAADLCRQKMREVAQRKQSIMSEKDKILDSLKFRLYRSEKSMDLAISRRDFCHWYQFKAKRRFQREYEHYRDQSGLLTIIINEIQNG